MDKTTHLLIAREKRKEKLRKAREQGRELIRRNMLRRMKLLESESTSEMPLARSMPRDKRSAAGGANRKIVILEFPQSDGGITFETIAFERLQGECRVGEQINCLPLTSSHGVTGNGNSKLFAIRRGVVRGEYTSQRLAQTMLAKYRQEEEIRRLMSEGQDNSAVNEPLMELMHPIKNEEPFDGDEPCTSSSSTTTNLLNAAISRMERDKRGGANNGAKDATNDEEEDFEDEAPNLSRSNSAAAIWDLHELNGHTNDSDVERRTQRRGSSLAPALTKADDEAIVADGGHEGESGDENGTNMLDDGPDQLELEDMPNHYGNVSEAPNSPPPALKPAIPIGASVKRNTNNGDEVAFGSDFSLQSLMSSSSGLTDAKDNQLSAISSLLQHAQYQGNGSEGLSDEENDDQSPATPHGVARCRSPTTLAGTHRKLASRNSAAVTNPPPQFTPSMTTNAADITQNILLSEIRAMREAVNLLLENQLVILRHLDKHDDESLRVIEQRTRRAIGANCVPTTVSASKDGNFSQLQPVFSDNNGGAIRKSAPLSANPVLRKLTNSNSPSFTRVIPGLTNDTTKISSLASPTSSQLLPPTSTAAHTSTAPYGSRFGRVVLSRRSQHKDVPQSLSSALSSLAPTLPSGSTGGGMTLAAALGTTGNCLPPLLTSNRCTTSSSSDVVSKPDMTTRRSVCDSSNNNSSTSVAKASTTTRSASATAAVAAGTPMRLLHFENGIPILKNASQSTALRVASSTGAKLSDANGGAAKRRRTTIYDDLPPLQREAL